MPAITTTLDGFVGTVMLHGTEESNVPSLVLVQELVHALEELTNAHARVIVLCAEKGAKVWSAGRDVRELPAHSRDRLAFHDPLQAVIAKIQSLPVPVIMVIQGAISGGACEVVLSCDILIGTPEASLTMTAARLGVPFSASGLLHLMNILPVNVVREMCFTAQPMTAERAYSLGVINHLVPQESIEAFTYEIARKVAANSPLSIAAIKEQVRLLASAHPISPGLFERIQALRSSVYDSKDYAEGIRAFFEKREPVFSGN